MPKIGDVACLAFLMLLTIANVTHSLGPVYVCPVETDKTVWTLCAGKPCMRCVMRDKSEAAPITVVPDNTTLLFGGGCLITLCVAFVVGILSIIEFAVRDNVIVALFQRRAPSEPLLDSAQQP